MLDLFIVIYTIRSTTVEVFHCYQSIRYFVVVYLVQELCDWKLKIPFGLDWAKLHLTLWSYLISLALRSHCVCKSGAYWLGCRSPCLLSKRVFALYELSSRPCVAHVEDNNGGWSPVTSTEGSRWRTRRNLPFKWGREEWGWTSKIRFTVMTDGWRLRCSISTSRTDKTIEKLNLERGFRFFVLLHLLGNML